MCTDFYLAPNTKIYGKGSRKLAENLPVTKLKKLLAINIFLASNYKNLSSVYEIWK
jgi:hypothetical protein